MGASKRYLVITGLVCAVALAWLAATYERRPGTSAAEPHSGADDHSVAQQALSDAKNGLVRHDLAPTEGGANDVVLSVKCLTRKGAPITGVRVFVSATGIDLRALAGQHGHDSETDFSTGLPPDVFHACSDSHGAARISGLPAGDVIVHALHETYAAVEGVSPSGVSLGEGVNDMTVVFEAIHGLFFEVVGETVLASEGPAFVDFPRSSWATLSAMAEARTGSAGNRVCILGVPKFAHGYPLLYTTVRWRILTASQGWTEVDVHVRPAAALQVPEFLDLSLSDTAASGGGEAAVAIRTPSGRKIEGVPLHLRCTGPDVEDRFSVVLTSAPSTIRLPVGRYRVAGSIWMAPWLPPVEFEISAGRTTDVRLQTRRQLHPVRVEVVDSRDGALLEEGSIIFTSSGHSLVFDLGAQSDEVVWLPVGPLDYAVEAFGYRRATGKFLATTEGEACRVVVDAAR